MVAHDILRAADQNAYRALSACFPTDRSRLFIESFDQRRLTFADTERLVGRLARLLSEAGVRIGDRVAGVLEKSPEGLLLYLAASRIGAIYVPIHSALTTPEIDYVVADAEPKVIVCDPALQDALAPGASRAGVARLYTLDAWGGGTLMAACTVLSPDAPIAALAGSDANALVYTSGTTGRPKGAILTHGLAIWNALTLARCWQITPDDVLLHANPMAYGLFGTTTPMIAGGAALRLLPKFDADAVIAALPGATLFAGVPTYYSRLLSRPAFTAAACRRMRLFITGSAPMRPDLFEAFRSRTGHALLDRYGLTEALIVTSNPAQSARRPDTSGLPLDGSRLRIVDEAGAPTPTGEVGMIELQQPYMFKGYWKDPAKSAAAFTTDGWFITGDFGRRDAGGYVSVLGRGSDLIISGGLNVYPKEVETRLNQGHNVLESAVIGVPHPDFGEAVVAVVQLADPRLGLDTTALLGALRRDMAAYKVPKHIEVVPEMPRNTLGKIQKKSLRETLAGLFDRPQKIA